MEQTFMTIHNLGPDANILFASESVADILGYQPSEVHGKSAFDYFHPEEVPFARSVHSRGVLLDKAAVLHYARILNRQGRWVGCECCFTIVHDVLVACTSIYRRNAKSERRAIEAPQIRRLFACSPRDPRYHMLEHLSPKFKMPPMEREPRAALILNRFTRNLTIMFATTSISTIVGLSPRQLKSKSFYRCIQESCLPEAMKCLESAKANDSIAYLRFSFQNPREDDDVSDDMSDNGHESHNNGGDDQVMADSDAEEDQRRSKRPRIDEPEPFMRRSSLVPIKIEDDDDKGISLPNLPSVSSAPSAPQSPDAGPSPTRSAFIELEAVVSCTSDGLVVVLRKARPPIPPAHPPLVSFDYGEGLFAAPWGQHPIRPHFPQEYLHSFQPPLLPQYMPLQENVKDAGGPPIDILMGSIRDVAVFAWGVVGINPAMAAYGRGLPSGDARPAQAARQGQHPDTRANEGGGGMGHTNGHHMATTPTGSPHSYPTTLDKEKACETMPFMPATSAAQHSESLYTVRPPIRTATTGYDIALATTTPDLAHSSCGLQLAHTAPELTTREQPREHSWPRSDHAPPRHQYAEIYNNNTCPPLPSPISPTGFSTPQLPLPSLPRDPVYHPTGYVSPAARSPQPNAGPYNDHPYTWQP